MKRIAMLCLLMLVLSGAPVLALDAASVSSCDGTTLIIDSDHLLWGLGKMSVDAFENGWARAFDIAHEPRAILPHILEASAGPSHRLALTVEGYVYAWGENRYGQLGYGSIGPERQVIEPTPILKNIRKVYAGDDFSLALSTADELYGWGQNSHGALGKGSAFGTTELRPDGGYTALKFPLLVASDIASFKVCSGFVFAFGTDGDIWCWGNDQPVRNPSTREMTIEAERKSVAGNFLDIAPLGYPRDDIYHFFVVREDASLWTARMIPLDDEVGFEFIDRIFDSVEAVLSDGNRVIALDQSGKVWQWDYHFDDKEGSPPDAESIGTPQLVLENAVEIAAGSACFFATQSDGTLMAWGSTADKQIGDHPTDDIAKPAPIFAQTRLVAPEAPLRQGDGVIDVALDPGKGSFPWLATLAVSAFAALVAIGMIILRRKKAV